jgi:hypothetical protein
MGALPQKVQKRLQNGVKDFAKVLASARSLDINESDTVKIIYDMLHDIFGYEKYVDITSEVAIRGTYCDLAIKHGGKVRYLIECKAVGTELKEAHLKQVVDYAANDGIDWVILTNAVNWQIYKIEFSKPIDKTFLFSIDFLSENPKSQELLNKLFLVSKEAIKASAIETFVEERKATDKYAVSSLICSEEVLSLIRRIIRSKFKGVVVERETLAHLLLTEIIKREIVESDQFKSACKSAKRGANRKTRATQSQPSTQAVKELASDVPISGEDKQTGD